MTATEHEVKEWLIPYTRIEAELALESHRLFVHMGNGKYWECRRNGKTQTWKTRPTEFRIPLKAGFKSYGEFNQNSLGCGGWRIKPV